MTGELERDRGRITLVDVVMTVAALFFLGALGPVVYDSLNQQASTVDPGVAYIYQAAVPIMVVVLLYIIFAKAIRGVGR